MYGRETRGKQGIKRGLVALLSLAMLLGLCVPGMTVAFGEQKADLTVTRGTGKVYAGAEYTDGTYSEPKGLRFSPGEGGILVEAPEGIECGTYMVTAGEGKSFTVAVVSGSGPETDRVDEKDQSDTGEPGKPAGEESGEDPKDSPEEESSDGQNPEESEKDGTGSADGTDQPDNANDLPAAGEAEEISPDPLPADSLAVPDQADAASPLAWGDVAADFHIHAQNATIAYSYRLGQNGTWSPLREIASGEVLHYDDFRTYSQDGYILFFVKPNDNCLMTTLSGSGFGDRYPIDGYLDGSDQISYGNINSYANGASCVAEAKAAGYISVLGYMRGGRDKIDAQISATCVQPEIDVTAVSDKTENVKPGDELTFTITVTPQTMYEGKSLGTVNAIRTKVTINGEEQQVTLSNSNGTWTGTLMYTATEADCNAGMVNLHVESEADYIAPYNLTVGSVTTYSTVRNSANVACGIAPQHSVNYLFAFDPSAPARPENFPSEPSRQENVYQGTEVTVDTTFPKGREVWDEINGGRWIFEGWTYHGEPAPEKIPMPDGTLNFIGHWTFEKTGVNVTIRKMVSGNMGDYNKEFGFTVESDQAIGEGEGYTLSNEGKTASFHLRHNGSVTLKNVPTGAVLTISESDADGYLTSINGTAAENHRGSYTVTGNADVTVAVENRKEADIDTGILTDVTPFGILLAAALAGGGVLLRKRKQIDG